MQTTSNQTEQKVYIGDQERYCTIILDGSKTARMLLEELKMRKELKDPGEGMGWAIWEVYSPMGLERPLRHCELLTEVLKSWSTQARSCFLLARPTRYARWLTNDSYSKSVSHGAYVHYETKKGHWNKRFLRLNDHSVAYTKNEQVRTIQETFLCTLTNFDLFLATPSMVKKLHAPRQFAFAIKSIDPVTFFENVEQDYIHFFSVKTEADLDRWVKACLTSERRGGATTSSRRSVDEGRNGPLLNSIPSSSPTSQPVGRQASSASRRRPSVPNANGQFTKGSLLESSPLLATSPPSMPPALPPMGSGKLAMPDQKTWERMTPDQRKEWLKKAQNNARSTGGTLLDFSNPS
ncbi:hypothetical protein BT69DRAFT_1222089 [Atractiella rhizophila]|nr:hypothetical protein BT69DRAFT_1222089 [Atractiella rhizophila]